MVRTVRKSLNFVGNDFKTDSHTDDNIMFQRRFVYNFFNIYFIYRFCFENKKFNLLKMFSIQMNNKQQNPSVPNGKIIISFEFYSNEIEKSKTNWKAVYFKLSKLSMVWHKV